MWCCALQRDHDLASNRVSSPTRSTSAFNIQNFLFKHVTISATLCTLGVAEQSHSGEERNNLGRLERFTGIVIPRISIESSSPGLLLIFGYY